ncbi:putative membrane protein YphA (DoxX/SURF4 family) [Agromyces terreus]|uniref:Membrane protein YphA (DoxX/SURF4 family) n=1 Tax=Agromyces terreus TaxID=424795 RepID=A0A9X2H0B3_9MICO|nr:DoxX family protein [Agromyces terreus]MCP2370173.1 putative membrane protein YphA (DoxX/SURF4 family) [Agromyces terreus]
MIIALWIATGLLALLFLAAGTMKSLTPREKLVEKMGYMEDLSDGQARAVGILEFLGALGLVLPAATGILPWLTPVAAFALALTMAVGTGIHVKRHEGFVPTVVLGVLALAVGFGWIFLG